MAKPKAPPVVGKVKGTTLPATNSTPSTKAGMKKGMGKSQKGKGLGMPKGKC